MNDYENLLHSGKDVVVCNPPWPGEGYGTRSNIRWPHRRGDKILTFPIYLAYAVSLLKQNKINVKGIDAVKEEWGIFRFVEEIKKISPKLVAMEVSAPSIMHDLQTAELLKKETGCIVVFIGPHATYDHDNLIENYNFIDYCIRDEFEFTLLELYESLDNTKDLSQIEGITYRDNSQVKVNVGRPFSSDLTVFPFPDREDFKIEDYQQAFFGGKKTALMVTSRGCPYKCTFCLWPQTLTGHDIRVRPAKDVVDEIELLVSRHGVDELYFDDDTFGIDRKTTKELCREIISRQLKISWLCMSRVNIVTEEILGLMKQAGCREIFYGFETGSDVILKSELKAQSKDQMLHARKITKKAGIKTTGSFVMGLPEESRETIKETLRFALKLRADYVQFTLASPFPGTTLYEKAKKLDLLHLDSWEDLDGSHGPIISTKHLSREELEGTIRWSYIRYYTHPLIIWENIKSIRDTNDVRKLIRGGKSILARIVYYKK